MGLLRIKVHRCTVGGQSSRSNLPSHAVLSRSHPFHTSLSQPFFPSLHTTPKSTGTPYATERPSDPRTNRSGMDTHQDRTVPPPPYTVSAPISTVNNHVSSSNAPRQVIFQTVLGRYQQYPTNLPPGMYVVSRAGGPLLPAGVFRSAVRGHHLPPHGYVQKTTGWRGTTCGYVPRPERNVLPAVVSTPLLWHPGQSSGGGGG